MKSLRIIQRIAKIIVILAKVAFVLNIVCASIFFLGSICLPFMKDVGLGNGQTLESLLLDKGTNHITAIAWCVGATLYFGYGIYVSLITFKFFKKEVKLGTPFTFDMAKGMRKLAFTLLISFLVASVVTSITVEIFKSSNPSCLNVDFKYDYVLSIAIALLVISLFCDYGAEREAEISAKTPSNSESVDIIDNVESDETDK